MRRAVAKQTALAQASMAIVDQQAIAMVVLTDLGSWRSGTLVQL